MAANGISTLPTKEERKLAKINLAQIKRQTSGTVGYRVLNYYAGTVSPVPGRPWTNEPPLESGLEFVEEDTNLGLIEFTTEDGTDIFVTE
jgi:hypothetical protein